MYRYIGNTGKRYRVESAPQSHEPEGGAFRQEHERQSKDMQPEHGSRRSPEYPAPVRRPDGEGLGSFGRLLAGGPLSLFKKLSPTSLSGGLNDLIGSVLPSGIDAGDILLLLLLLLLYMDSRDDDFLIILIVMGYSIFKGD